MTSETTTTSSTARLTTLNDACIMPASTGSSSCNSMSPSAVGPQDISSLTPSMTSSCPPSVPLPTNVTRRGRASPSPVNRIPLTHKYVERKAKRCRFYRNGDRWFPGAVLAVSTDRHRTFDSVLEELTRLLEHPLHLVAGVRYIFALDGTKIDVLDKFVDSQEYVASSTDNFKNIDYRAAQLPQWRLHTRRREALHVPGSARPSSTAATNTPQVLEDLNNVRPRLVTVFRNGQRPRKAVRVLFNRRTARSLDQVLADLSTSLKLDSGAVRKIYALDGGLITSLKDLFKHEVFIACGHERFTKDDFFLDVEESRSIQTLIKSSCTLVGGRKRMPSPKGRGRTLSPSSAMDPTGSLPRGSRLSRESPSNELALNSPQQHMFLPSAEELFLPVEITSRYNVGRILGDGNFAVVRECKEISTNTLFALKIIDKSKCQGKEDMIVSEVEILKKVNHENIVRLEEDLHYPDQLYLVMELVTGGDLFDAIAQATRYTEYEAAHLVRDLASALQYLHHRNIVHRDVKPENLLVVPGELHRLKLGDFGLAVELTEPLFTICGTPTYVAPEILAEHGYGMEVDIWAAGVITYILLCGFPPFISQTNNQEELFEQILAGVLNFPSPYWDHVGQLPRELIASMVLVNPHDRYTADHVLQHPWIMEQCMGVPVQCDTYSGYEEADTRSSNCGVTTTSNFLSSLPGPPPPTDMDSNAGFDITNQQHHFSSYDYQHNEIMAHAANTSDYYCEPNRAQGFNENGTASSTVQSNDSINTNGNNRGDEDIRGTNRNECTMSSTTSRRSSATNELQPLTSQASSGSFDDDVVCNEVYSVINKPNGVRGGQKC